MTTTVTRGIARILWQTADGVPEDALVAVLTADPMIELHQRANCVLINIETVPELIRVLRELAKESSNGP